MSTMVRTSNSRPAARPLALVALLAVAACSSDRPADEPASPPTSTADTSTADTSADMSAGNDAAAATRAMFASVGPDDPGCTVAAGRDGEVRYAEAFGAARLDPTEPMTPETIVDIGSTSKQFTATAVLLLVERGQVDLDAPLATYLPDVGPWAERTTVRQLMHHTSGIPDYIELLSLAGFELTGSSSDADALAALAAVTELDFEPGRSWAYSNSNYFLLGQIVLAVTGEGLGDFLTAEVFEPLDLAMVMDPVAQLPGKAVSYDGSGDDREIADSRWEQLGDGGIQTTPRELVRWASQYWDPTIGGPTILTQRLDDAADIEFPDGTIDGRYGAGIQIFEDPDIGTVLSHSGGWGGFVTVFLVVPEERLAVAATCTSPETAIGLGIDDELDFLEPWLRDD